MVADAGAQCVVEAAEERRHGGLTTVGATKAVRRGRRVRRTGRDARGGQCALSAGEGTGLRVVHVLMQFADEIEQRVVAARDTPRIVDALERAGDPQRVP
ncbi:hypothetical protein [Burkholderia territorii]|uniref:hypothetical protein n=1 Tax=Burkholderia territorii TaxID=1503055 RepID=UPI0007B8903D|nr:hypothetical protein [Burkholderia territorii]